jgi:hypothetical protein
MNMEGVQNGEYGATAGTQDLHGTDSEESDLQLVKAVSEIAAHLTADERGKLRTSTSIVPCVADYHRSNIEKCSVTRGRGYGTIISREHGSIVLLSV